LRSALLQQIVNNASAHIFAAKVETTAKTSARDARSDEAGRRTLGPRGRGRSRRLAVPQCQAAKDTPKLRYGVFGANRGRATAVRSRPVRPRLSDGALDIPGKRGTPARSGPIEPHRVGSHGTADVLHLLLAREVERQSEFALQLVVGRCSCWRAPRSTRRSTTTVRSWRVLLTATTAAFRHSARTESNSGTRASGRLDPFAAPFGYDRYVRTPAIQSGTKRLILTTRPPRGLVDVGHTRQNLQLG
jgi:hypothetical protein